MGFPLAAYFHTEADYWNRDDSEFPLPYGTVTNGSNVSLLALNISGQVDKHLTKGKLCGCITQALPRVQSLFSLAQDNFSPIEILNSTCPYSLRPVIVFAEPERPNLGNIHIVLTYFCHSLSTDLKSELNYRPWTKNIKQVTHR